LVDAGVRLRETAVQFGSGGELIGVVAEPPVWAAPLGRPGIIFLNAGLIHRVGPYRLHVRLGRKFASRGMVSLRFDFSGIGDSRPAADGSPIMQRRVAEAQAAMDLLNAQYGVERFVLVGNCSGAVAAFHAGNADRRVVGLGLINLPGHAVASYYLRLILSNPKTWRRLLYGRAKLPRLLPRLRRSAPVEARTGRTADFFPTVASLAERGVEILLANCEWDRGYDYFHRKHRDRLQQLPLRERLELEVIPGANHEFGSLDSQQRLIDILDRWASRVETAGR
jgi:pimeloyl-ACP methyl ester carboxylesterase